MNKTHANPWVIIGLTVLLLAAMAGSCLLGAVDFEASEVLQSPIFWQLRLPRVLMSVLVGAVLSVCGAAYQSVFRNPLTDPYVQTEIRSGNKEVRVTPSVFVRNNDSHAVSGTLSGWMGEVRFEKQVTLPAQTEQLQQAQIFL